MRATNIKKLIESLYILSRDIQSQDGVANACIAEGAESLQNHHEQLNEARKKIAKYNKIKQMFYKKEPFALTIDEVCEIMDSTDWEVEDSNDVMRILNNIMPLIYKKAEKLS